MTTTVKYFSQVWANAGDTSTLPDAIDVSGGASYTAGFNANFSRDLQTDPLAKAIPRTQFNQLMQDVTGAIQQIQQNGVPVWISNAMNDGTNFPYAQYARVLYTDGHVYESLVGTNTVTPTNDGINWRIIDASAGARTKLTGATTFYVNSSTGNDTTGKGTSGLPWATIQHAVNYIYQNIDSATQSVTINFTGDDTNGFVVTGALPGAGTLSFVGDNTIPTNATISSTNAHAAAAFFGASFNISGFYLTTATSGNALIASNNSSINSNGSTMKFGAVASGNYQVVAADSSQVTINASAVTISGGGTAHIFADQTSVVIYAGNTVTATGSPAFSSGFVAATAAAFIYAVGNTFSGTVTGPRFTLTQNAIIFTSTNSLTYFPGNAAGFLGATCTYDNYFGSLGSPIQSWTNVTGSRALGTTYTNSTVLPIMVSATIVSASSNPTASIYVAGNIIGAVTIGASSQNSVLVAIVPPSATYEITASTSATIGNWQELR